MTERRTTVDGLADVIMDGLKEYADLATDTVKDAVKDVSKTVKKDIQANAPKRTGRYKKSIGSRADEVGRNWKEALYLLKITYAKNCEK